MMHRPASATCAPHLATGVSPTAVSALAAWVPWLAKPALRGAAYASRLAMPLALALIVNPVKSATELTDEQAFAEATTEAALADPAALISSMSTALRELNYEGTFVHIQGMSVSTMHILHANDGAGELERMRSLDGEAREIIRDHSLVTCIWPGTQSVVVSKSKPRRLLPEVDGSLADNVSYLLQLDGMDRVAGRETRVVSVVPRDAFRYGYRFWIDDETRMLLRSMMLNGEKSVEQVLFTTIAYPEHIDRARFDVSEDDERITWIEPQVKTAIAAFLPSRDASGSSGAGNGSAADGTTAIAGVSDIQLVDPDDEEYSHSKNGVAGGETGERVLLTSLPEGYRKLSESYESMPGQQAPVSHVMVSDGMASVSVYVEHAGVGEQDTSLAGLSSMGAMNAFGLSLEEAFVTVVGEVPADTVVSIAEAVRLAE